MKKMLIAFSAIAIMFTACKKEKDEAQAVTPTKENLTGTWMITAHTLSASGNTVDVYNNSDASMNIYEACDRDDKYILKADLSYEVVDAGTQCSPDNNSTGGTWEFTNSTTVVIEDETGTINSFDGKNLVVSNVAGSLTSKITYVKQ